jgi:hypothetical protein
VRLATFGRDANAALDSITRSALAASTLLRTVTLPPVGS